MPLKTALGLLPWQKKRETVETAFSILWPKEDGCSETKEGQEADELIFTLNGRKGRRCLYPERSILILEPPREIDFYANLSQSIAAPVIDK